MLSIVYQNKIIYSNLTEEECTDILFELAEKSYDGQIDPNQIKIEETKNG
jgi:hypothetical protein